VIPETDDKLAVVEWLLSRGCRICGSEDGVWVMGKNNMVPSREIDTQLCKSCRHDWVVFQSWDWPTFMRKMLEKRNHGAI
jgi:hypothetical protein